MKIGIIGSGSWGTALACKAAQAGNESWLYCRREEQAIALQTTKENKEYLKGVILPDTLTTSSNLKQVVQDCNILLIVTPSIYVRSMLQQLRSLVSAHTTVVICSKGIERETGKRLSEVANEELGTVTSRLAILSGPNHAEEIGRDLPATTVVAATTKETAEFIQKALSTYNFRVYVNEDMIGVELAGTTKNIIALAAGIVDGMALGDNCKSALLTRGLHEMTKFGVALGARRETYAGLAGMGDLIATCMSPHSRNRAAGQKLADGETMDYIMNHSNMVVEGFFAVKTVYEVAKAKQLDMPITSALYEVLYHQKAPKDALMDLMGRHLKDEMFL
ncbi:NAD(P)H-dependent glycerol-3-phosphate dehydrogenase [Veillonella criceti]|uniref:Glycerol-3-phosphate dehydrogenase [NAD(P)+] n=1 Tax=Veillonella criceti TaxID=103891 RepID=A0A380NH79_9FIRM|nr:NAD(P)H-dependent glycerol-3-phosphate dehydrogenase [Veillonella criceti]SUP40649.1 Glycerol-3-phosphate dehydrogenase [NAD(P)+] [Veillonella criceti]